MKRKTTVTAVVLSAALLLAACGAPEEEDPLAALKENATSSTQEKEEEYVEFPDGEQVVISDDPLTDEELEKMHAELQENAPAPTIEEDLKNAEGTDASIHDKNFGDEFVSDHYGVDIDSVEIPQVIEEAYSDYDTSRIVPSLLEAFDWAAYNTNAKLLERTEAENISRADYMAGYFSDNGQQHFLDAMNDGERVMLAFAIMPIYRETLGINGEMYEVASRGYWPSGIGNVQVQGSLTGIDGADLGGVQVDLNHSVYVPLKSGEYLVLDFAMSVVMTPGVAANDNDWVIDNWSAMTVGSSVVGEDAVS